MDIALTLGLDLTALITGQNAYLGPEKVNAKETPVICYAFVKDLAEHAEDIHYVSYIWGHYPGSKVEQKPEFRTYVAKTITK